ncbi:MAG: 3'(2'),5'-bisphosphate nucleotidase CysQ [Candidatus Binataceae bacterium]
MTTSSPPASKGAAHTADGRSGAYTRELTVARDAALAAGEILERYYRDRGFRIDSKGRDNPVTTADLEADHKLRELLCGGFPDYGWLSEETADDGERLMHERVWIVDPLDGTKEFIKGVPEFAVAIALSDGGKAVMGVTYNPIKHEMYWGAIGAGCYLGEHEVHVTRTRTLRHAIVLASRSETSRGEWRTYEGMVTVKPVGSVAYKLALVAGGAADATFTRSPKSEWDIASGAALIEAAGGRITDVDGGTFVFNKPSVKVKGLVASNGLVHAELESLLPHAEHER